MLKGGVLVTRYGIKVVNWNSDLEWTNSGYIYNFL